MFHAQELGSYAQGQGSLAVFKVTARNQGHYKGPSGAFVTYCYISCFLSLSLNMLSISIKTVHHYKISNIFKQKKNN